MKDLDQGTLLDIIDYITKHRMSLLKRNEIREARTIEEIEAKLIHFIEGHECDEFCPLRPEQ